jgi:MazG family protein
VEDKSIDIELSRIRELVDLIEKLRGEDGCPWDRKQTPQSMAPYLLEEIYELMDAIESEQLEDICEELGDVWFHILFIAAMYREAGRFDIGDISKAVTEKMIRRHPHVFGRSEVNNSRDVKIQWQKIKAEEKNHDKDASVLDSVPKKTPALIRAHTISDRAAKAGFDWHDISEVIEKVEEELSELKEALAEGDREAIALEFGDILFTLVNVARFAGIHSEPTLSGAIRKFESRFRRMEKSIIDNGKALKSVSREEFDNLWQDAKGMSP